MVLFDLISPRPIEFIVELKPFIHIAAGFRSGGLDGHIISGQKHLNSWPHETGIKFRNNTVQLIKLF